MLAEVSGAHLNPAISMGLLVGKRISLERFIAYLIAQASYYGLKMCSIGQLVHDFKYCNFG